jgi:coenzyme F420 hydrogenase subunit beta
LRHEAASGGALSACLVSLLETGEVDAVLSVAADPHLPFGNQTVLSRSRQEILSQAASRYAPSKPLDRVAELLDSPERIAFVGKPCDVAGLRLWAQQDARIDVRFPVKLSFFCAGVPSLEGGKDVIRALGMEPDRVNAFRYRGRGWPGQATASTPDGREASMRYEDSWGAILSKHVQHRCRICADGIGLGADIAFADAWECDAAGYPLFDEQPGRSAIIARSKRGQRILDRAKSLGLIDTLAMPIERLTLIQPGQRRRREELLGRLAGKVLAGEPIPRYRHLQIWQNGIRVGLLRNLKACLGMARRRLAHRTRRRPSS